MPRSKKALLADLTINDLKKLLVARKQIDVLEKRKNQLTRELTAVDKELAKLLKGLGGSAGSGKRKKKSATKKTTRKKTSRKKTVRKKATGARSAASGKKAGRSKMTLEEVVARLIKKKGAPIPFKDLSASITKGRLFFSKSKNFDNVLRRTLSTSKKIKRVGRGLYDVS